MITGFFIFALCLAVVVLFSLIYEQRKTGARVERRLRTLEDRLHALRAAPSTGSSEMASAPPQRTPRPTAERVSPSPGPPPLKPEPAPTFPAESEPAVPVQPGGTVLPVAAPIMTATRPTPEARPATPGQDGASSSKKLIDLEQFLGVKLFAWIGGLILFLGVAFFVKHAFENNLISPQVRVTLGYLTGLGLVVGGMLLSRERSLVTVQTLCATGAVILYANVFASHAYYHFLDATAAFILMSLVTALAFGLAIRLNAQYVAVLGLLGGFLTPPLLSSGVDRALGLFGYVALLDTGLLAVALRKRWNYLVLLAAVATVWMQIAWVGRFFVPEKITLALGIFLFFSVLFVTALAVAQRRRVADKWMDAAASLAPAAALVFVLYLFINSYRSLSEQVGLVFGFVFLVDLGFLANAWQRDTLRPGQLAAGGGVFFLLFVWTLSYLKEQLLFPILGFYLVFALLHALTPVWLQKRRPVAMPLWWAHGYPILALLLLVLPFFKLETTSLLVWPVVLMIDLVAMLLALLTASMVSVLAVFLLTMLVTGLWIITVPPLPAELPAILIIIGGFAVFFLVAGIFIARKLIAKSATTANAARTGPEIPSELLAQVASLGGLLPFLLLALVIVRLPLADPTPVFALGLVLVTLYLGVVRRFAVDALGAVGLVAALLIEHTWHFLRFAPEHVGLALGWYLGLAAVFLGFPFCFQEKLKQRWLPWSVAALALPLHFYLLHNAVARTWPEYAYMGLVPLALAVPCLAGWLRLGQSLSPELEARQTLLAWFGGATLFFVTLVFPIQFDRQWITLGWALEGVALLWLFHRLPHPGLKWVGVGLLVVAFARLAINPAVLDYHPRSGTPIWNWFLYAYGMVVVCLMVGAGLLAPPRNRLGPVKAPPLLYTLGTVLAFLLLNIEIADAYSKGPHLTFQFSADLAQDMTYSLAWGVFAFILLSVGFKIRHAAPRYCGLGLLLITIVKLFLHDLWRLGGMYRVGSLIGLAVVLIVASFIYQRFLAASGPPDPGASETSKAPPPAY